MVTFALAPSPQPLVEITARRGIESNPMQVTEDEATMLHAAGVRLVQSDPTMPATLPGYSPDLGNVDVVDVAAWLARCAVDPRLGQRIARGDLSVPR